MKDITFHYTNKNMIKDLLSITPYLYSDSVLDAGSGKNKEWFNLINCHEKYECEIEDGNDFFEWDKKVDWIIGNPPYHISWKFTEKASCLAQKGIAWLINNQALNSHFTPKRLDFLKEKGFTLKTIKVVADKRWFGRYYYIIFTKEDNNFLSWERKTY